MQYRTLNRLTKYLGPLALALALVVGTTACASTQTPGTQIDDNAIQSKVNAKIAADPETNPFEINVDVNEGVVYLTGTVDDVEDRAAAERIAQSVRGVVRVDNEITYGDQTVGEMIDDSTITAKVKSKIAADSTLNPFNIQVTTENGVVQLTGRVATSTAKDRASDIAEGVKGVRSVKNKLEVGKA